MFRRILLLVTLSCATVLADPSNFKQLIDDDSILVSLENGNYALSSTELKQFNWASVSINGGRARIYSANCETSEKKLDELGTDERRLFYSIVRRLKNSDLKSGLIFSGGQIVIKEALFFVSKIRSFQYNDQSLHRIGAEHYALRSNLLAEEKFKWAISNGNELLTFIDDNDIVQMLPMKCVGTGTTRLVEDSKREVEKSEASWESDPRAQHEVQKANQTDEARLPDSEHKNNSLSAVTELAYSCNPISEPPTIDREQIRAIPSNDNKALVKFAGYLTLTSNKDPKRVDYMTLNVQRVSYSERGDLLRIVTLDTDCAEIEMRVNKGLQEYQINQVSVNIKPTTTEEKQPECQMELDWRFLLNTYWKCDKLQIWTHCSDYTNSTNPYDAVIGLNWLMLELELDGNPSAISQGLFSKYPAPR